MGTGPAETQGWRIGGFQVETPALFALPRERAPATTHRRGKAITELADSVASSRPDVEPPATRPARTPVGTRERAMLAALLAWSSAVAVIDAWSSTAQG
jgi:hypothetical protein